MGAVHSIWVISSAISIRNNWDVILKGAGFSYVFVERLADLQRIRPGDFVILTLNKVSQYKKQIGRYIKQLGYKIQFIFDESDNISNPSSKQALSVLSCFRRCKYKLLTTGTSTRNNISEFAPQLELLYNNSINMISWCRTLYSYDKRSADMEHKENPYYAMPVPAYKKGYRLFANSHLPEKITVFGVGQRNQDIYNADELDRLLGKTVITRTFEEVTGKDIRRIHQMPIPFLPEEREVYNIVLKEFYRIQREYYSSTGNSRKDALMRLIQQIKKPQAVKLTPACAFTEIFSGAQKTLPLSGARYPASLVAYSRSDYDGWRWWTTWFPDEEMRPAPELGLEIDAFQSQLLALPEFKTLWAMERMCRLYAQPTKEPTEFNLYAETAHFHVWLRLITRERDYNLYTYFFAK